MPRGRSTETRAKISAGLVGNTNALGLVRSPETRAKMSAAAVGNTRAFKHGHATRTATYMTWQSMWQRCTNTRNAEWKNYGGRGITVCDRWRTFENFLADMGEKPPGLSIDRFPDNDGNYEPSNCRWATASEQRQNQRPRRRMVAA